MVAQALSGTVAGVGTGVGRLAHTWTSTGAAALTFRSGAGASTSGPSRLNSSTRVVTGAASGSLANWPIVRQTSGQLWPSGDD